MIILYYQRRPFGPERYKRLPDAVRIKHMMTDSALIAVASQPDTKAFPAMSPMAATPAAMNTQSGTLIDAICLSEYARSKALMSILERLEASFFENIDTGTIEPALSRYLRNAVD